MAAEAGAGDDAEGTGGHAVRAAVADVRLNVDVLELVMDDGAGRASLLARSRDAVLADVAHHEPATVREGRGARGEGRGRRNQAQRETSLILFPSRPSPLVPR